MNFGKSSDWTIKFDEGFAEDLRSLGHDAQIRIKKYLDKLTAECSDPRERGEPYRSNLAGYWKYRVGNYRLICTVSDEGTVTLYAIAASHRSNSYSAKSIKELLKRASELEKNL